MDKGSPRRRRHSGRANAIPIAIFVAIVLTAVLLFLEYDILTHFDERDAEAQWLQIEEAFALATILVAGLLVFSIRRMRDQRRELEARLAAETEARKALELALLDPLTGLANRRHFDEIFHAAAEKGRTTRHGLFLLDLNDFKQINDADGHPAGDHVLQVVSQRLQRAMKPDDLVSRLGGDEFAVVAFNLDSIEHARKIATRLVQVISEPTYVDEKHYRITTSVGFTLFPTEGMNAKETFARADEALYEAKARKNDGEVVER